MAKLVANTIVQVGNTTSTGNPSIINSWYTEIVPQLNTGITYGTNNPPTVGTSVGTVSFDSYMGGNTAGDGGTVAPEIPYGIGSTGTIINATKLTNAFIAAVNAWGSIRNTNFYVQVLGGELAGPTTGISYLTSEYAGSVTAPAGPQTGEVITANLSSSGAYAFSATITSNTSDYSLYDAVVNEGIWNGASPVAAIVTIASGVTVSTTNSSHGAFTTGSIANIANVSLPYGSSLTLIIQPGAYIIGGTSTGAGTALQLTDNGANGINVTTLINNGVIGGGTLTAANFSGTIGQGGRMYSSGYQAGSWGNNPTDASGWPYAAWRAAGDSVGSTYTAYYPFIVPAAVPLYYTFGVDNVGTLYYATVASPATDPTGLSYTAIVASNPGFPGINNWSNFGTFAVGTIIWLRVTYENDGGPFGMTFAVSTTASSSGIFVNSLSIDSSGWPTYGSGNTNDAITDAQLINGGPSGTIIGQVVYNNSVPAWPATPVSHPLNVYMQQLYAAYITTVRNSTISITTSVCHSSCHSSCHGSRGRR